MKRLMKTQLLKLQDNLTKNFDTGKLDIHSIYDEFVNEVLSLYNTQETEIPTFFTLQFTQLELHDFLNKITQSGGEKKIFRWNIVL